jgi:hypothetical protein
VIDQQREPAFYARSGSAFRDWVTLVHPPYTAWHLGYVVVGGCLAADVDWAVLGLTVLAFFLALGLGAHALDELHGRPLGTAISRSALIVVAVASTAAACVIGLAVAAHTTGWLVPLVVIGALLVPAYNLELFGGAIHTDAGFALAWGAFPLVTAFVAQTGTVRAEVLIAAAWAAVTSLAQRQLSTTARRVRRDIARIDGTLTRRDGTQAPIDRELLLAAPETALRLLAASVVLLAATLAVLRL